MSPSRKVSNTVVYQLKITLKGSTPPIWRRIQVVGHASLARLHKIFQAAMGWWNYHLHVFVIRGQEYGRPDGDLHFEFANEQKVKLGDIVTDKEQFLYEYDFGDGWLHQIVVEKIFPLEKAKRYPICLAGARACPPEDCGGIGGYAMFLEAINNPNHKEHSSMLEWIGGSFDPEAFNLDRINDALKRIR